MQANNFSPNNGDPNSSGEDLNEIIKRINDLMCSCFGALFMMVIGFLCRASKFFGSVTTYPRKYKCEVDHLKY